MIEIVCPSCQARYQLPDGAIGPQGRKVSCSSCSHKWRANAEGAAPAMPAAISEAEPASVSVGAPEAMADSASMAAVSALGGETAVPIASPPPATGDREDQMATIRQMLSDLKEGADAAPEPETEERPAPVEPVPTMRKRAGDDDDDRDPLKSRIDHLSQTGRSAKGAASETGYDAQKLRRLHEKRAKKLLRSRERKKKSGALMTGFTLVSVVTATLVGLYVMKPQIVTASPRMAPAMNEYVVAVDQFRVDFNEKTAEWRAWLTERTGKLGSDEE